MSDDNHGAQGSGASLVSNPTLNKNTKQNSTVSNSHTTETPPNVFVKFIRSIFGYRKTSLTLFVILTYVAVLLLAYLDHSLYYSVDLPTSHKEQELLHQAWVDLQHIAKYEHAYGSSGNDYVHDYLESRIVSAVAHKSYVEYDNDLNYTNNIMFGSRSELSGHSFNSVSYYESNNLVVRINGTDETLPALLLSAHFDSVPSSFGVTDDGMGIASLLGVLYYYTGKSTARPRRTIVLNFNNDEEFGLYGATSFLSHPWATGVHYFLNLEGTGAGGKAILFRGTDYGITKYFKGVRYPYGTSIFQQGFNNHLIHSETDYKIYKEKGGLRGLDVAFYKPRDLYHTAGDNIKNIDIKSLWHMLSNALDFTAIVTKGKIDLDADSLDSESSKSNTDTAVYTSFLNFFFAFPTSQVVVASILLLVLIPGISIPFLIIIFGYKKNWELSFVNVTKFPISLAISAALLNLFTNGFIVPFNQFLPNSSPFALVAILFATFLLLNYLILNGINLIFVSYKIVNHDEKLISIIETSFLYWVVLIYSTAKLANNVIGDDHSGEFPIIFLCALQAVASIFGLIGWSFKPVSKEHYVVVPQEEAEPLLGSSDNFNYGSPDVEDDRLVSDGSSLSLNFTGENSAERKLKDFIKTFSYDWSIQFLTIVPISTYLIYNSGFLVVDGINKSIQESLISQNLIYKLLQTFAISLSIPLLPFIFKVNRLFVLALFLISTIGVLFVATADSFNVANPLKLRFIQYIDLDKSAQDSFVSVIGREASPLQFVLSDIPSVKDSKGAVACVPTRDGLQDCSYKSSLDPKLVPGAKSFDDYLKVDILKNSSSNVDYPFGLLTGEIRIRVPKNRECVLDFKPSESTKIVSPFKDSPVKTVIVYKGKKSATTKEVEAESIPEGFSKDKDGNYVYKDLVGIDQLQLNKLDWDKSYHVGFQWVPNFSDVDINMKKSATNKLNVSVKCFWAELGKGEESTIPAYEELLHYSPNYVSWANSAKGLVSVSKTVEL
ncbi:hypothetical protein G9P44_002142 [Scheffersomyces stipitis]|nr:hypothetical protein G9P44_002142 [Scheffersomyces stipitis]